MRRAATVVSILVLLACAAPAALAQAAAATPAATPAAGPAKTFGADAAAKLRQALGKQDGCIEVMNLATDEIVRTDAKRCAVRQSPCSTFKIYNALVGLDAGVIENEGTTYRWDGVRRPIESWNRDLTLAEAIRVSSVWWFQRMAREIGPERMKAALGREPYGDSDISGGIDRFWLESSLHISPDEQVAFIAKLYRGKTAFKPSSVAVVKKIIVQPDVAVGELAGKTGGSFSGKTGSGPSAGKPALGWFVGHLASPKGEFVFAVEIEGAEAKGPVARGVAIDALRTLGLLPR